MTTLYELAAELRYTQETLEALDVPPEVVADTLEGIQLPFNEKAVAVGMVIRNLDALAKGITDTVEAQNKRLSAVRSRAQHLRDYLCDAMQSTGTARIDSPEMRLRVVRNPPTVIVGNPEALPVSFMRFPEPPPPPPPSPDKARIKEALQRGEEVPGASLMQTVRLAID